MTVMSAVSPSHNLVPLCSQSFFLFFPLFAARQSARRIKNERFCVHRLFQRALLIVLVIPLENLRTGTLHLPAAVEDRLPPVRTTPCSTGGHSEFNPGASQHTRAPRRFHGGQAQPPFPHVPSGRCRGRWTSPTRGRTGLHLAFSSRCPPTERRDTATVARPCGVCLSTTLVAPNRTRWHPCKRERTAGRAREPLESSARVRGLRCWRLQRRCVALGCVTATSVEMASGYSMIASGSGAAFVTSGASCPMPIPIQFAYTLRFPGPLPPRSVTGEQR